MKEAVSSVTNHQSPITRAFVFAAGLGTRLRPYTLEVPKPMLELYGRPLILYVLAGLARAGVRRATVNAAWLAEAFETLPDLARTLGIEVDLSVQPRPLLHGGDLAFAAEFHAGLGPDEVYMAVNGDTIVEYDVPALGALAGRLGAEHSLVILGRPADTGRLRVAPDGTLVGIGDVDYATSWQGREHPAGAASRWDDSGLRLVHAGVREFLPPAGTEMSLHGATGLIGRLMGAGRRVSVAPAPVLTREEVGTVEEYEGRERNAGLRALAERLIPS